MSLPPTFLDELRSRVSIATVVGRRVTWDQRKSNQGKGDMWAPCPFHQEKTASFHVDDRKGFYHCFGCGAKGDAITFLRELDNLGFMEAVEVLAREAGMQMPARDPQAAKAAKKQAELTDVIEMAVQHYRLMLHTAKGARARDYLASRGLDEAAQERWGIGYAPDARQGLLSHLRGKDIPEDMIVTAGLCARPDGGGTPYDRFRDRIIFPIRDARGRAISLGGRALSPEARAKYLNGPESPVFHKGRALYNIGPARSASGRDVPLIVAEGYMDVIALSEHGFGATVAPLGTAITAEQLEMLWRVSPEPVIALDGDAAGLRAAMRLISLALPLLEPGRSLRFCLLPEGQDPDDLLRAGGAGAMRKLLDAAEPMVNLLWRRETEGRSFDSPERRAMLDDALAKAVGQIANPVIRRHYDQALRDMKWNLFRPQRRDRGKGRDWGAKGRGQGSRFGAPEPATPGARRSPLAAAGAGTSVEAMREAVILATLLTTPAAITKFETALETLEPAIPEHEALRTALLRAADLPPGEVRAAIAAETGEAALENLLSLRHVQIAPALRRAGDLDFAIQALEEEFAKLAALRGARREIDEAEADITETGEDAANLAWRLRQSAEARDRALRAQSEDKEEYERAPNGALVSRAEREAFAELRRRIESEAARKRS